jgi:aldehyde dehydrogenase (NAD+)
MRDYRKFYIDGQWVDPAQPKTLDVVNPATEAVAGVISLGSKADVDRAVAAAQRAFVTYSQTTREERMALLAKVIEVYKSRLADMAQAISEEMGAPLATVSMPLQAPSGLGHLMVALGVLKDFEFEKQQGTTSIVREPVGVCGMITPWNWPANQIACKVAPALATGCTMVLKPSEIAPLSGHIFAEILHEAGVPKGVFNMVDGDGPTVGAAISSHPGIDMVSFTGSTRAGILVDKAAADTVKKVSLELGGKSPNIILEGAPLQAAVGHSCRASTSPKSRRLRRRSRRQSSSATQRMRRPRWVRSRAKPSGARCRA